MLYLGVALPVGMTSSPYKSEIIIKSLYYNGENVLSSLHTIFLFPSSKFRIIWMAPIGSNRTYSYDHFHSPNSAAKITSIYMWDIFYHLVYFLIQKSVNILQIHCILFNMNMTMKEHCILSACPSQITSWKLICCYENIIKLKQKGI